MIVTFGGHRWMVFCPWCTSPHLGAMTCVGPIRYAVDEIEYLWANRVTCDDCRRTFGGVFSLLALAPDDARRQEKIP